MSHTLQLGPFELGERIGKGGMGEVYSAHHTDTGARVAVKVLLGHVASQPEKRRDFRREVRAMARLNHPGIATVVDYGTVDQQTARASRSMLTARAPWLAMEHIDAEPLDRVIATWRWRELRHFMRAALDALAHAHARGVVHRDLKPSNVLVDSQGTFVKLVDFGISRIFDNRIESQAHHGSDTITGTPKYMAPEQALGQWRDQGPWTDLYAFGCISWLAACAKPVFEGESNAQTLQRHISEPPPKFRPRFAVPEGFEPWLRSLLVKRPTERVSHAADARWALDALAETVDEPKRDQLAGGDHNDETHSTPREPTPTQVDQATPTWLTPVPTELSAPPSRVGELAGDTAFGARLGRPPVPPHWQRDERQQVAPMPSASLRLFGLRTVPVVDRERERTQLWEELRQVDQEEHPRLVVLEGGPGTGKSRLAQWLIHRTHEVGVGVSLTAVHTATGSPVDGLRGMVRRWARTAGLERREVLERLVQWLPPLPAERSRLNDARALAEYIFPNTDDQPAEQRRYQLGNVAQEHALLGRLFARLAQHRPLIVWLDDLQWSSEAIGAVDYLLTRAPLRPRVLFVATVQADLLVARPDLHKRLERLCKADSATRIELDALSVEDHRELIDRLINLDEHLVDLLVERTEGNPLFAIQLVQDWVERGYLEMADEGFALVEGIELELPDDVDALWTKRVERLVAEYAEEGQDEAKKALELAAALGREVDTTEWRAVCRRAGVAPPESLDERLVERGLARQSSSGFTFIHGLLVDSLALQARRAERWTDWHCHCAKMLADVEHKTGKTTALRRGHHWMAARQYEQAIEPFWQAARRASLSESLDTAAENYALHEEALDQVGAPPSDRRRIEAMLELADVCMRAGKMQVSEALIDQAEARLEGLDEARLQALAHLRRSTLNFVDGHVRASIPDVEKALELFRQLDDPEQEACLRRLAHGAWRLGNPGRALSVYEQALDVAQKYDIPTGAARRGIGFALYRLGHNEEARQQLELAKQELEKVGNLGAMAGVVNTFGELARQAGRLSEAEGHYRHAYQLYEETGAADMATAAANLGLVQIERGEYQGAASYFEQAARQAHRAGYRRVESWALCGLVATCAAEAVWPQFDEHLQTVRDELGRIEHSIRDIPYLLTHAGHRAVDHGQIERARLVFELACEQWELVGDDEEVRSVEQSLETLA